MTDAATMFFENLDRRGEVPLLKRVSGTVRIDLHSGAYTDHWVLSIDDGKITVSRDQREADSVIGADPELFEQVVRGEKNALTAMFRGDMTVDGNLQLILRLERLFPGPPGARGPRRVFRRGEPR